MKTGEELAAKFEKAGRAKEFGGMLFNEAKLIHKLRGKANVPKLYFIGPENSIPEKPYNLMVMELLLEIILTIIQMICLMAWLNIFLKEYI